MASLRPVLTSALLTLTCLAPPGFALSPSGADAEAVLGGLTALRSGRVEGTLSLGAPSRLGLTVDGTPMTLLLEPHSVRAPGFTVELRGKGGKSRFLDPGPVRTVRGTIAEIPGSEVAGIILPTGLEASLRAPGVEPVWLEPAAKKRTGVDLGLYSLTPCSALEPLDTREKAAGGGCGAPSWSSRGEKPEPLSLKAGVSNCAALGGCEADIAFDVDSAYYSGVAGSSATVAQANAESLLNLANPRFANPFLITHRLTSVVIRTNSGTDPYADPSITTDVALLHTMTGEWPSSVHTNDLVHLLTNRSFGGVGGAAWYGGVCGYGSFGMVSFTVGGGNDCARATGLIHELGHSWGAHHTSACGIMTPFPGTNCSAAWCSVPESEIATRRDQVAGTCLALASQPPVAVLKVSCSGLGCSFDGSASTDEIGIASYAWSYGDAASGSGATPSHTYGAGGTYTATLTVTDTNGLTSSASRKINLTSASAAAAESYFTVAPCRVLDTRNTTILTSGTSRTIQVSGVCNIPSTAKAVSVTITSISPTGAGHLVVQPGNLPTFPYSDLPSTLNFDPSITVRANNAVLRLATDGSGTLDALAYVAATPGQVHLVVDVAGFFSEDTSAPSGSQGPFGFQTVTPCRVADTRSSSALSAGTPRNFTVQGVCGIPSGATAAALNLAAISPSAGGYIVAYPSNISTPGVSNVNFIAGASIVTANGARLGLHSSTPDLTAVFGSGGGATTHLVIDAQGYFSSSASLRYHPIVPCRAADTRYADLGAPALGAGETRVFPIRGNCGIPSSAKAAFANLVAVGPTGGGYLAAFAQGTSNPGTSNLNYDTTQGTIGNGGIVPLGTGANELAIVAGGTGVHVIVDVFGYFD